MQSGSVSQQVKSLAEQSMALILAGGHGTRLKNLTRWHAKPAIPFGGQFRTIDFSLSNCLHSGIRRIGILTQYKSYSLNCHIQRGWNFLNNGMGDFIDLLPAQQRTGSGWYQGTADAVYQNLDIIEEHAPTYVVVLAGDHVYKMDYGQLLLQHQASQAPMTVACVEVDVQTAEGFGVLAVDWQNRIYAFEEKPVKPRTVPGKPDRALASMGVYVFNTDFLLARLRDDASDPDSSHDFGKDIIPRLLDQWPVNAYPFVAANGEPAYWRDVGTLDQFWQANMNLLGDQPLLDLFDLRWPVWTTQEQLPPSKFVFNAQRGRHGQAIDSMVSNGCQVYGATVRGSILFNNVSVGPGTDISESLILSGARIGSDCRLNKVIIDQRCVVPDGTVIGEDAISDARRYTLSPGGVVLVSSSDCGLPVEDSRYRVPAVI
ncbi:glucose-1-phosphate adenylyltransferase [Saccharospirillum impatiens]|uniref:glucose-1-phosphate adenylyltransferase n=1 Tax=Saccharospirillum impatiens TaxID=169438 RepID=UPI00041567B1|nr:glucose-1-phosphate adenylyltransferase [Saccharospirillum impatiens]